MGAGRDRLIAELIMVQQTGYRWVGLMSDVNREFQRLDKRWRSKLERHFRNYGIQGTTMPQEQFKSEGRFPTGGPESQMLQVYAFKAFQHRIYGATISLEGRETFVGMELVTKKQDKADQELLRRVAQRFRPYLD
jgi:hypothetical protein